MARSLNFDFIAAVKSFSADAVHGSSHQLYSVFCAKDANCTCTNLAAIPPSDV